jgi:hypothetical protein
MTLIATRIVSNSRPGVMQTSTNARASRNWHRARKFLKKVQRAQASQLCTQFSQEARSRLAACPLADLTRLPKPIDLDIEPEQEMN